MTKRAKKGSNASAVLRRVLGIHVAIVRPLKSLSTAFFLSQLYYWQAMKDPALHECRELVDDGWVYKTQQQWDDETTLTVDQQMNARKKLKKLGLLEEKYDRTNHRLYYRLLAKKLDDWIDDCLEKEAIRMGAKGTQGNPECPPEAPGKTQSGTQGNPDSYNKDSEITTKNTTNREAASQGDVLPEAADSSTPSVVDLPPTTGAAVPPFDSAQYIEDMMDPEKEKNKAVRLIGNYLYFLGDSFPSAKAIRAIIPLNIRLATAIVEEEWTDDEMLGLMEELANDPFWKNKHWSLKHFKDLLPKYRAKHSNL